MLTHLRKIFYGTAGWDRQLIRGGASVPCRYLVRVVETSAARGQVKLRRHHSGGTVPRRVEVLVREGDWMNPHVGTEPEIYASNHQEVVLSNGLVCDIGHVLAGMDAMSYPTPVAPLPSWMMCMYRLVPHVNDNADASTWLGDLSSVTGELFFFRLHRHRWPDESEIQQIIDEGNPGPDMLGNIDAYAVQQQFGAVGKDRISDILSRYYVLVAVNPQLRYLLFCSSVGIELDSDNTIVNAGAWIRRYQRELKACTAFYAANRYAGLRKYWYALIIWLGIYRKRLMYKQLLQMQLDTLQKLLKK